MCVVKSKLSSYETRKINSPKNMVHNGGVTIRSIQTAGFRASLRNIAKRKKKYNKKGLAREGGCCYRPGGQNWF